MAGLLRGLPAWSHLEASDNALMPSVPTHPQFPRALESTLPQKTWGACAVLCPLRKHELVTQRAPYERVCTVGNDVLSEVALMVGPLPPDWQVTLTSPFIPDRQLPHLGNGVRLSHGAVVRAKWDGFSEVNRKRGEMVLLRQ